MAKINQRNQQKQTQRGITLIELLMYNAIFFILFLSVMSSVFYLQKIIQNNNQNYYVKNQIYTNLNILQRYMYKNYVVLDNQNIKIFTKSDKLILTQNIENNQIKNIYQDKSFLVSESIIFTEYNISQTDKKRLLKFEISWLDSRGKKQSLTEYLVVINVNI